VRDDKIGVQRHIGLAVKWEVPQPLAIPNDLTTERSEQNNLAVTNTQSGADLKAFLATVVQLTGAKAGALRAISADGAHFRLVAAVGLPEMIIRRAKRMPTDCGMCGEALRHEHPSPSDNLNHCAQGSGQAFFGRDCKHGVAVPMDYRDQTIGVFNLFFESADEVATEIDKVLRPFGLLLGLALENDRLSQENLNSSLLTVRQAMASDIHDSLAQSLLFMRTRVSLLKAAIENNLHADALKYCSNVKDELANAHRELRHLLSHFRAGMDSRGLKGWLVETVERFFESSGIALELSGIDQLQCAKLSADQETQVYHVVREALANIQKHSWAKNSWIRIALDNNVLEIEIEDDGAVRSFQRADKANVLSAKRPPFDTDPEGHFGLQIMRERAERAYGQINFMWMASGLRVILRIPFQTESED
jgi:two-component system, NarL family, nitrate/nitrite sensor histidine kinase NarX